MEMKGFQRKYLRGLAHGLKPVVTIGQRGMTDALARSVEEALDAHELIKMKFIDFKEKESKQGIVTELEKRTGGAAVGMIGHTVIFYRAHPEVEKRSILVPERVGQG